MPYVPGCRRDVFISYASETDREGWVTLFVAKLKAELEELLGRRFSAEQSIYFSPREQKAGDNFPESLRIEATQSALLIPVLSQGYVDSPWCEQERIHFLKELPEGAGVADCIAPMQIRPIVGALPDEFKHDTTHIFSFIGPDKYRPLAAGSPEWTLKVNEFAVQIVEKLKTLRFRYRPVYVGRSPAPNVPLRERVCSILEKNSFRTTADVTEHAAVAVHFVGGSDGEDADFDRLNTIERVKAAAVYVFQPFGQALSPAEKGWADIAPAELKWISQKDEQELLDILQNEMTRLVSRPMPVGDAVLAYEPIDDGRVSTIALDLPGDLVVKRTEFHLAFTAAERLRRWSGLIRHARALVFCWGESDHSFLEKLETYAAQQVPARKRWYLLEPGVDDKRAARPNGLMTKQELEEFLRDHPEGTASV